MFRKLFRYRPYCVIIYFVVLLILSNCVSRKRAANENEQNIKKVEMNMSKKEVHEIMGHPTSIKYDENLGMIYYYEPTFGSSDGIYIYFSNENRVLKVILND